jgi:kynurenine formamidase
VLIDVAAHKGVDMLPDDYEITVDDLQQALTKQNVKLEPGDAIIIHTGWGKLWEKDNARYVKSCPGIGVAAAEWLVKQDPLSSAKTRSVYDFSVIDQPDRPWTLSTSTNELTLDMTCTSP